MGDIKIKVENATARLMLRIMFFVLMVSAIVGYFWSLGFPNSPYSTVKAFNKDHWLTNCLMYIAMAASALVCTYFAFGGGIEDK